MLSRSRMPSWFDGSSHYSLLHLWLSPMTWPNAKVPQTLSVTMGCKPQRIPCRHLRRNVHDPLVRNSTPPLPTMGSILSSWTHPEDSISAIRLIFSTGGKISFD